MSKIDFQRYKESGVVCIVYNGRELHFESMGAFVDALAFWHTFTLLDMPNTADTPKRAYEMYAEGCKN